MFYLNRNCLTHNFLGSICEAFNKIGCQFKLYLLIDGEKPFFGSDRELIENAKYLIVFEQSGKAINQPSTPGIFILMIYVNI